MARELLALPAQIDTASSSSKFPTLTPGLGGGENGNIRGKEVEQRVANVLATHPSIASIHQTEQNSIEDRNLTDLIVDFTDDFKKEGIDQVNVQVKASSHRYRFFRQELKRRLERQGLPTTTEAKDQYLIDNNVIVIVGGERETKITPKEVVPDERIIADFSEQLTKIVEANRKKLSGE